MTATDEKYVVFKRKDWERFWNNLMAGNSVVTIHAIDDAVVIRRQDVFAPPALDAYANAIMATVEGLIAMPIAGTDDDMPGITKRLRVIADYFHQQATLSWDTVRKLPD